MFKLLNSISTGVYGFDLVRVLWNIALKELFDFLLAYLRTE